MNGCEKSCAVERVARHLTAEQRVARELPIDVPVKQAVSVRESVPFWFHTFQLNRAHGIYTPGVARDHGYRLVAIPPSLRNQRVLDIGTCDGFYAFLCEYRAAASVIAIDNGQYIPWVTSQVAPDARLWDGFNAIKALINSRVVSAELEVADVSHLNEQFDLVLFMGVMHRLISPLEAIDAISTVVAPRGALIIETHGCEDPSGEAVLHFLEPGQLYPGDSEVYWRFTGKALGGMLRRSGFDNVETLAVVKNAVNPRIIVRATRNS